MAPGVEKEKNKKNSEADMTKQKQLGKHPTHPEKVVPKSTPTINLSAIGAKSLIGSLTGPLMASVDEGRA